MKSIKLSIFLALFPMLVFAQNYNNTKNHTHFREVQKSGVGKMFLNLSSGIDNPGGLFSIGLSATVSRTMLLSFDIGSGTNGTKFGLMGKWFLQNNYLGSAFGFGFSRSNGLHDMPTTMTYNGNKIDVYANTKSVSVANFTYNYYVRMGRRSRFFVQPGLAIRFSSPQSVFFTRNMSPLDHTDTDYINTVKTYKTLSPGGLILSAGLSFSLGR